jgi:nanoRNase/pAp phosphatase (c-di-AMP/oligoRNAs hydrolase)
MQTYLQKEEKRVSNNNDQTETMEKKQPQIAELLEAHRGEHHVIVIQDYPDPDAISSACAHQLISTIFDIETDIVYSGKISHQQNIALVRLLGIRLTKFDESLDFEQYDGAVFVDNQGTTAKEIVQALEEANVPPLIIVDHHEKQDRLKPEFSDIRYTGAVATIYAQYLEQGLIEMDKSKQDHVTAATALMHGIMTDTGNYTLAKAEDFQAAAFLSRFRDGDLLGQITNQARTKQVMEIIHQALGNRVTAESYSIAGIGYLRAEARDAIPQAADFLLSEENVHTAIVYGIVVGNDDDEFLIGSLRTSKITIDPDQFIKDTFGKDQVGNHFGGGKTLAGGFEIPVGFLSGDNTEEYRKLKWEVYDRQIKQKIFAKIGVEQE